MVGLKGRMAEERPERSGEDRRTQPRGGRRPGDADGLTPLVIVVGDEAVVGGLVEAVLAKLKFAVARVGNVEEAVRVLPTLRPNIAVASAADAGRLRLESPHYLTVVVLTDAMRDDPYILIDDIRAALRAASAES
jgi:hypothetical protein